MEQTTSLNQSLHDVSLHVVDAICSCFKRYAKRMAALRNATVPVCMSCQALQGIDMISLISSGAGGLVTIVSVLSCQAWTHTIWGGRTDLA